MKTTTVTCDGCSRQIAPSEIGSAPATQGNRNRTFAPPLYLPLIFGKQHLRPELCDPHPEAKDPEAQPRKLEFIASVVHRGDNGEPNKVDLCLDCFKKLLDFAQP